MKVPDDEARTGASERRTSENRGPERDEAASPNAPVSAGPGRAPPEAVSVSFDPDDALRAAIKAAVDAGDIERAQALLAVLQAAPRVRPARALRVLPGRGGRDPA